MATFKMNKPENNHVRQKKLKAPAASVKSLNMPVNENTHHVIAEVGFTGNNANNLPSFSERFNCKSPCMDFTIS